MKNLEQSRRGMERLRGRGVAGFALTAMTTAIFGMAAIKPKRFDTELITNFSVDSCQVHPDGWAYGSFIEPDMPPSEERTKTIGLTSGYSFRDKPVIEDGVRLTHATDGEVIAEPLYGDRRMFTLDDVRDGPVPFPSGAGHEVTAFGKNDPDLGEILGFVINCDENETFLDQHGHRINVVDPYNILPRFSSK